MSSPILLLGKEAQNKRPFVFPVLHACEDVWAVACDAAGEVVSLVATLNRRYVVTSISSPSDFSTCKHGMLDGILGHFLHFFLVRFLLKARHIVTSFMAAPS
jgi:hypothetical protein